MHTHTLIHISMQNKQRVQPFCVFSQPLQTKITSALTNFHRNLFPQPISEGKI